VPRLSLEKELGRHWMNPTHARLPKIKDSNDVEQSSPKRAPEKKHDGKDNEGKEKAKVKKKKSAIRQDRRAEENIRGVEASGWHLMRG
jgi:hypothetical protein